MIEFGIVDIISMFTSQNKYDIIVFMTNLTKEQLWIYTFLKNRDWTSPTEIGRAWSSRHHSSWASPKCKKLVEYGLLERNEQGWYRIRKEKPPAPPVPPPIRKIREDYW